MPVSAPPGAATDREKARLAALEGYRILDTAPEAQFDDIVAIAAQLCGVPMALISLVDDKRQWFKAALGMSVSETPREIAFCNHAIQQRDILLVEDATRDARFADNPLVTGDPHLRFYAGAPLQTAEGLAIGTLCVLDSRPGTLTPAQHRALQALARQVMNQLELRKVLAQQLAQEEISRLILDSAVDYAIIALDLNGLVTNWNEGARRILGWTAADMCGQRCDAFFTEEDRVNGVPDREMGAALTKGRGSDERWHLRKDGTRFFASGEMMPLTDDLGKPVGFLKILRDRTDQRMAERMKPALLELGDRLGNLVDPVEMAFAAAEVMGHTLQATATAYGIVDPHQAILTVERGWTADAAQSVVGRHPMSAPECYLDDLKNGRTIVIGDTRMEAREEIAQLSQRGVGAVICHPLLEQGKLVAMFFALGKAAREWDPAEVTFVRDVAERTRLAIERRRAEFHYRELAASLETQVEARVSERNRLWASTSDLMATAGLDGFLKEINPAWTRLLGWEERELLSRPFLDFINTADHAQANSVMRRLSGGEVIMDFIDSLHTKDGGSRTVTWSAVPDGDVLHIVGRDISTQRDMEERLRQSQKMEAIGQLTGGIAHDFNNLLAGILGSVALIRLRLKAGRLDSIERFIDAAERSAKSAASLTERLLAFSRRQSLDAKPHDVNRLIAEMEDLLHRTLGEGVKLRTTLRDGVWLAITDGNQLENAILNLAINARDAMPDGGELIIDTANVTLDESFAALNLEVATGDYVAVSVSDTGHGMSPDVAARAFDPFFTTKPIGQGTGLGLSMIYGFAKQSGGHVRLSSEVGCGTTITLYLPRAEALSQPSVTLGTAQVPRGDGETVLIVEDDATVRMLVVEVLSELGYAYLEAADPATALKFLDSDIAIHLLLTDVGLPHMNGRQLAETAKQKRGDIKVLFLTGYAENAVVRGGFLGAGMDMISKPFALDALATKVRDMLSADITAPQDDNFPGER